MRILITGADGFIGSHLTEALVRSGHEVRAFDALSWFFGGSPLGFSGLATSIVSILLITVGVAAVIGLMAIRAYVRDKGPDVQ